MAFSDFLIDGLSRSRERFDRAQTAGLMEANDPIA